MSMMGAWRLLLLAWAAFLMFVGPARAETTTERALAVACGPGHTYLAQIVEREARRQLLHPVLVVAVLHAESRCRMDRVGRHGEVCAMQLRGAARHGHSRRRLARDPALCIATGARWLALRGVDCGGTARDALAGYNGRTCKAGKPYARRVLRTLDWIWAEMARREERRS